MSLYFQAEAVLLNADKVGGSLKSRVYNKKDGKHAPAQVYALVSEATKWSPALKEVIERSELLKLERKLTATLAILLVHDLLLSKRGIAAPSNHALHLAVSRHKARLQAEFTKLRIRRGIASVDDFREDIESQQHKSDITGAAHSPHPRWVRINALKTTMDLQLSTTFKDYARLSHLHEALAAKRGDWVYHVDENVPDLIALPPNHDVSKSNAYQTGQIIFQDKASCIPAVLLDPATLSHGHIIDACAAPGNKTTHLAALVNVAATSGKSGSIVAVERNPARSKVLSKMVAQAGASQLVKIMDSTDFLELAPENKVLGHVTAILLDPSCSGSGIVGRDDEPALELPALPVPALHMMHNRKSKKRKWENNGAEAGETVKDHSVSETSDHASALNSRLEALSKFQLKLLLHAMTFPTAERIVYSTCSVHAQENEDVVMQALCSDEAVQLGWSLLRREQQVVGMRTWEVRGDPSACKAMTEASSGLLSKLDAEQIAEACIRCEKGTSKGTMGFFACGFIRVGQPETPSDGTEASGMDDEWEGFAD